jgi:small subunit ribosomal protein S6
MAEAAVALPHRVREYETIYVLRPDVAREGQERIAARITEVVARENGKLTTLENWGRRQLAYTVSKFRRGVYVYVRYLGGGVLVNEVERNLRMLKEDVLKFQTVQVAQDIDLQTVEVRPESVKFEAVEPATPEELAEPIERLLGLEEAPERERPPAPDEDEFEVPPEIEGGGNVP